MAEVYIKAINNEYIVKATGNDEATLWKMIKQKLEDCMRHSNQHIPVFFDISTISESFAERLLLLCKEVGILCKGFIEPTTVSKLEIVERDIYCGQDHFYEHSVLILGDVWEDAKITCLQDVYVMGTVFGTIDVYDKHAKIGAARFQDAMLRICDTKFQKVTNLAGGILYYEQGLLKEQFRRERNGRSNRSDIWKRWSR